MREKFNLTPTAISPVLAMAIMFTLYSGHVTPGSRGRNFGAGEDTTPTFIIDM